MAESKTAPVAEDGQNEVFKGKNKVARDIGSNERHLSVVSDKSVSDPSLIQIPDERESAYQKGAAQLRRSLLLNWCATVFGTAVAFAIVSGIKDIRALVTTSMSAGSIAFVVSALSQRD